MSFFRPGCLSKEVPVDKMEMLYFSDNRFANWVVTVSIPPIFGNLFNTKRIFFIKFVFYSKVSLLDMSYFSL